MAAKPAKEAAKKDAGKKSVEALTHKEDKRRNIPTAEFQPLMREEEQTPLQVAYERRNKDLDPQLVWRGKDLKDWSDLVVSALAIYIQEKVHPKVLIDNLKRRSESAERNSDEQLGLFGEFNGVPEGDAKTEFYQHDANWTNRMILGDSLQVMASLAEREGLRGKVQCIYMGDHITREPEQVKAFRDTWKDGIHSYLTYIRDRLVTARDLLTESGSVFVQMGDENVHRLRIVMDEVFGEDNCVAILAYSKTTGFSSSHIASVSDNVVWYARNLPSLNLGLRTSVRKQVTRALPGTNRSRLSPR